ncbi:uncharacterized protein CDAR_456801 [Caerostris darwini]|uniref:Uncharacterized protein n=1 Tax=Caerostris darwini TaxID=1538125 RepID=A0AAV4TPL4_9ARAC|nr:uncharacterized protein CDAR_456801 [Caerostris darwini]
MIYLAAGAPHPYYVIAFNRNDYNSRISKTWLFRILVLTYLLSTLTFHVQLRMTDLYNMDVSYGGNPFLMSDSQSRDPTLDASQVLAAALEQMDDIIAATSHELEIQALEKKNSTYTRPSNTSNDLLSSNFYPVKMPDTYETALPVNNILDNLKDHIIANGGNDNFVSNQELNLTSAKVVFNWLEKLLKDSMADTEVLKLFDPSRQ